MPVQKQISRGPCTCRQLLFREPEAGQHGMLTEPYPVPVPRPGPKPLPEPNPKYGPNKVAGCEPHVRTSGHTPGSGAVPDRDVDRTVAT